MVEVQQEREYSCVSTRPTAAHPALSDLLDIFQGCHLLRLPHFPQDSYSYVMGSKCCKSSFIFHLKLLTPHLQMGFHILE